MTLLLSQSAKLSIAFKKLVGRNASYEQAEYYEEDPGGGFNIHNDDIWVDPIPTAVQTATDAIVKVCYDFADGAIRMTKDSRRAGDRAWMAIINTAIQSVADTDWIPPKYGANYVVRVYADDGTGSAKGTQVPTTDAMKWFFDYERGVLTLETTPTVTTPFYIEAYRYIGTKGISASTAAGTDELVKVDSAATAGYLYNSGLGTLRTSSSISVNDSGDYITIGVDYTHVATSGHTHTVFDSLTISGNLTAANLSITANATVIGTLKVCGAVTFSNTLQVSGDVSLSQKLNVSAAASLSSTLWVSGSSTFNGITNSGILTTGTLGVTANASVGGTLWVCGTTTLYGNVSIGSTLYVCGDATICGTTTLIDLRVFGTNVLFNKISTTSSVSIQTTLWVCGATTLNGLTVSGSVSIQTLSITGNVSVGGTLWVCGATTLNGLTVSGNATVGNLSVTNNATVVGTLNVCGIATFSNHVVISGKLTVSGAVSLSGTLEVGGAANFVSAISVSSTLDVVGAVKMCSTVSIAGAVTISSTLTVTGAVSLSSTLYVAGAVTFSSSLTVSGELTVGGTARFNATSICGNFTVENGQHVISGLTTTINASQGLVVNFISVTAEAYIRKWIVFTGVDTLTLTHINGIQLFGKLSSGLTKLMTVDSAGTEVKLGAGGGAGFSVYVEAENSAAVNNAAANSYLVFDTASFTIVVNGQCATITTIAGAGNANTELSNLVATKVNQSLCPTAEQTRDLGGQTCAWRTLYVSEIKGTSNGTTNVINIGCTLCPTADSTGNLGTTSKKWDAVYCNRLYYSNSLTFTGTGADTIELVSGKLKVADNLSAANFVAFGNTASLDQNYALSVDHQFTNVASHRGGSVVAKLLPGASDTTSQTGFGGFVVPLNANCSGEIIGLQYGPYAIGSIGGDTITTTLIGVDTWGARGYGPGLKANRAIGIRIRPFVDDGVAFLGTATYTSIAASSAVSLLIGAGSPKTVVSCIVTHNYGIYMDTPTLGSGSTGVGVFLTGNYQIVLSGNSTAACGIWFGSHVNSASVHMGSIYGGTYTANSLYISNMTVGSAANDFVMWDTVSHTLHYCAGASARIYKKDIRDFNDNWHGILSLQPKIFTKIKNNIEGIGYIAEDVEDIGLEKLLIRFPDGRLKGLKYDKFSLYAIEVIKEQDKRIQRLEDEITQMASTINKMADKIMGGT